MALAWSEGSGGCAEGEQGGVSHLVRSWGSRASGSARPRRGTCTCQSIPGPGIRGAAAHENAKRAARRERVLPARCSSLTLLVHPSAPHRRPPPWATHFPEGPTAGNHPKARCCARGGTDIIERRRINQSTKSVPTSASRQSASGTWRKWQTSTNVFHRRPYPNAHRSLSSRDYCTASPRRAQHNALTVLERSCRTPQRHIVFRPRGPGRIGRHRSANINTKSAWQHFQA